MKKLFKNKKALKPINLYWHCFSYAVGAVIWTLFMHLVLWNKPEPEDFMQTIIIFQIFFLIKTIAIC